MREEAEGAVAVCGVCVSRIESCLSICEPVVSSLARSPFFALDFNSCPIIVVFPLISPALYSNLGDSWACSVFAFLAAACMPVPFLFYVSRFFPRHKRC